MPPPRVRFTMRQMMVIVAALAMVVGTVEGLRRRGEPSRSTAVPRCSHKRWVRRSWTSKVTG